ncbi:MAG: butyrate kinase [Candidatus Cloacimonetes bacterium]|jgi:butyrate kinase|nr:butyrate kinase [Candidatus Cloacimonadota bacterium]MBT6993462.1 butyrate kinase [Candidatus Cloacimonadota bacterium]MBT7469544.1 butyrate kinase [Candidatus Cloacimonadota bacterium]
MKYRVLAINPGSTSTKIAVFDDTEKVFVEVLRHDAQKIAKFGGIIEQFEFRKQLVLEALQKNQIELASLNAVVGRGGLVKSVDSGTYEIDEQMLTDLKNPKLWGRIHASNLGAFIAKSIADDMQISSFIVDPVTVDEFCDFARISGVPEIERKSLFHALNIRFIAHKVAEKLDKEFADCNMVAVHLGGGVTVAAIKNGKVIDANNALLGMGPFSPQRAGALPIGDLLNLAFSGKYSQKQLEKKLAKESGFIAYLGTDDGLEIENLVKAGDEKATLIHGAMCYQIAKEIGGYATILEGKVDAIILTGGLIYDPYLLENLKRYIKFIAPIFTYPGEKEMEALTQGAVRVLKDLEKSKKYY